jgi:hypothetical protein
MHMASKILHARAVTQVPARFAFQSYFSNALSATAILNQASGSSIVASTKQSAQTPGVGVALHASSKSPVAIRFHGGNADSAEVILVPGQRLDVGAFDSFDWGLPFGWLGGGTVLLYVIHRPDAFVDLGGKPGPIPLQRLRLTIGNAFPGVLVANWPAAFPWGGAVYGTDLTPQAGSPIVNVQPTRTALRLRSALAAPTTLAFVWRGDDDFDTGANGLTVATADLTTADVSFPSVPAGSGAFPFAWLPTEISVLGGDSTCVTVIDANVGAPLNGAFIDVVRYGMLS